MNEIRSFTDISHCPDTGIATYAFVIKYLHNDIRRVGKFKDANPKTHELEALAIRNALHVIMSLKIVVPNITTIYMFSDSANVVHAVNNLVIKGQIMLDFVYEIEKIRREMNVNCKLIYVKGKQESSSEEAVLNNWCHNSALNMLREIKGYGRKFV